MNSATTGSYRLLFPAFAIFVAACVNPAKPTPPSLPLMDNSEVSVSIKTYSDLLLLMRRDYFDPVDSIEHADNAITAMWNFAGVDSTVSRPVDDERSRVKTDPGENYRTTHLRLQKQFTWAYTYLLDLYPSIGESELAESAFAGLLQNLDPESMYITRDEFLQMKNPKPVASTGIEFSLDNGQLIVIRAIENSPADRAGIRPGDTIVRIDDSAVKDLSEAQAMTLLRGERGSQVFLSIIRRGEAEPQLLAVNRDYFRVSTVDARLLEPGFGYVRISTLQARTSTNLLKAVSLMQEEGRLDGLILDLRSNSGGLLNSAVGVSDAFLDQGLILATDGRQPNNGADFRYMATPGDVLDRAPLVVLVNGVTASGAEAVAAALQDHKRALVVGNSTFGHGSIHTIQELLNGGAIKIKTAELLRASGQSLQDIGVVPDICLRDENKRFIEKEMPADDSRECPRISVIHPQDADKELSFAFELLKNPSRLNEMLAITTERMLVEENSYAVLD